MEIKIGVQYSPREISLESEEKPETISKAVDAAISAGSLLKLTDDGQALYDAVAPLIDEMADRFYQFGSRGPLSTRR